MILQFFMCKCR